MSLFDSFDEMFAQVQSAAMKAYEENQKYQSVTSLTFKPVPAEKAKALKAADTGLFGLAPNLRKLAVALTVSIPPERLVKRALKKMFRGKKADTPGFINWLSTPLLKHTPDWILFLAQKHLAKFMH